MSGRVKRHEAVESQVLDREIVISRVFDAPRELLWKVWTNPVHLAVWWGPQGFSTTTSRMDVKVGGQWRFVMHGPDGHDYQNLITYSEVKEPERLVYKHGGGEGDLEPVNFTVTVTFDQVGERTKLTMRMVFPSAAVREFVMQKYGALEGGLQHLGRLGDYVTMVEERSADESGAGLPFVLSRVVKAPRALVFKAWTEREHLMKWFGPRGTTMPSCTLDFRVGGSFHYGILMAGTLHWGLWKIREIVPGERIVVVASFADERGTPIRAPWDAGWPMEMLTTITFADHAGIGRGTLVTVQSEAINCADAERAKFDEGKASMRGGWGGTLDRLCEVVEAQV